MEKPFDFEERTYLYAKGVDALVKLLPRNVINYERSKQLVKSSGSVGANYLEANEAMSIKDRLKHLKISRKEAKESRHWLRLLDLQNDEKLEKTRQELITETNEILCILSTMIHNSQKTHSAKTA